MSDKKSLERKYIRFMRELVMEIATHHSKELKLKIPDKKTQTVVKIIENDIYTLAHRAMKIKNALLDTDDFRDLREDVIDRMLRSAYIRLRKVRGGNTEYAVVHKPNITYTVLGLNFVRKHMK